MVVQVSAEVHGLDFCLCKWLSRLNSTEIGLGLTGFDVFFSFLGMVFFFDKGLLAMGNILFFSGVTLTRDYWSCVDTFHEEKSKRERRKENKALTMELLAVAYSSLVAKMEEVIYRLGMLEFSAAQKYSLASNSTYNVEEAGDL